MTQLLLCFLYMHFKRFFDICIKLNFFQEHKHDIRYSLSLPVYLTYNTFDYIGKVADRVHLRTSV